MQMSALAHTDFPCEAEHAQEHSGNLSVPTVPQEASFDKPTWARNPDWRDRTDESSFPTFRDGAGI
jgi:hypothetical protein